MESLAGNAMQAKCEKGCRKDNREARLTDAEVGGGHWSCAGSGALRWRRW